MLPAEHITEHQADNQPQHNKFRVPLFSHNETLFLRVLKDNVSMVPASIAAGSHNVCDHPVSWWTEITHNHSVAFAAVGSPMDLTGFGVARPQILPTLVFPITKALLHLEFSFPSIKPASTRINNRRIPLQLQYS